MTNKTRQFQRRQARKLGRVEKKKKPQGILFKTDELTLYKRKTYLSIKDHDQYDYTVQQNCLLCKKGNFRQIQNCKQHWCGLSDYTNRYSKDEKKAPAETLVETTIEETTEAP